MTKTKDLYVVSIELIICSHSYFKFKWEKLKLDGKELRFKWKELKFKRKAETYKMVEVKSIVLVTTETVAIINVFTTTSQTVSFLPFIFIVFYILSTSSKNQFFI